MVAGANLVLKRRKHLHRGEDDGVERMFANALEAVTCGELEIVVRIVLRLVWPVENANQQVDRRIVGTIALISSSEPVGILGREAKKTLMSCLEWQP